MLKETERIQQDTSKYLKDLCNVNDLSKQLIKLKQFEIGHQYDNRIFIMCLCEVEVKLITANFVS